MSDNVDKRMDVFGQGDADLERTVARFEEAWLHGEEPRIEAFLVGDDDQRQVLLLELIHADMECRLKAGDEARVEDYLERFPDLSQSDQVVIELICTEYSLRHHREPDHSIHEYLQRFPQYESTIAKRLAQWEIERVDAESPVADETVQRQDHRIGAGTIIGPYRGRGNRIAAGRVTEHGSGV